MPKRKREVVRQRWPSQHGQKKEVDKWRERKKKDEEDTKDAFGRDIVRLDNVPIQAPPYVLANAIVQRSHVNEPSDRAISDVLRGRHRCEIEIGDAIVHLWADGNLFKQRRPVRSF